MKLEPLAFAVCLTACSTPTTIESTWRDPNYPAAAPMRSLIVLARVPNEANRRTLEDTYAATLSQHGVRATPSYRVFQASHPDRQTVRQFLDQGGYDGLLVSRFEGVRTQTTVAPDANFDAYYGDFWGGGYYLETDQYVRVETSLWDAKTRKLVWSAVSETENPSSSSDAITSVVSKVTSSMTQAGLIPPMPAVSYQPRARAF